MHFFWISLFLKEKSTLNSLHSSNHLYNNSFLSHLPRTFHSSSPFPLFSLSLLINKTLLHCLLAKWTNTHTHAQLAGKRNKGRAQRERTIEFSTCSASYSSSSTSLTTLFIRLDSPYCTSHAVLSPPPLLLFLIAFRLCGRSYHVKRFVCKIENAKNNNNNKLTASKIEK